MSTLLKNMVGSGISARTDLERFWGENARQRLTWFRDFHTVLDWRPPYAEWFLGGTLNASYNCLDRHVEGGAGSRIALRWESDSGNTVELTFEALLEEVCRFANVLKRLGIERGDRVAIYLPEIPELVVSMLSCARIGAVHTVVHCALSSDSLTDRINDATAELLIAADGYYRHGEVVSLKTNADEALIDTPSLREVVIVRRVGDEQSLEDDHHHWYDELMSEADAACRPEPLASEELLYVLYTSGATGQPKGIMHTTAGFLTQVAFSHGQVFDARPGSDVFWCNIDTAAAPGHSYGVYGALLNGVATFMCENALDHKGPDRLWGIVERHGVSQLYVSPATLRLLMDHEATGKTRHDLSSLRVIATVGAPLPIQARHWLSQYAGEAQCSVIDTWWQTETGAMMLAGEIRPAEADAEFVSMPLPGIEVDVVDASGASTTSEAGHLVVTQPWPAMLRGVWDAPKQYRQAYWSGPRDAFYSGDYARLDTNGGIRLLCRAGEIIDTGRRIVAPTEIEDLLNAHQSVAESAVVGVPDNDATAGDNVVGFVVLRRDVEASDELAAELADFVIERSEQTVRPEKILFVPDLPKTSDGKCMCRLLRDVVAGRNLGDTTALLDEQLIDDIRARAAYPENWCWNSGPIEPGKIAIVDIDGVVADAYYRMRGIDRNMPRTEEYFKSVEQDDVIEEVAQLLNLIRDDIHVVLLSARPLRVQDATIEWLRRHGVRWDLLILRATSSRQMPLNYKRHRTKELLEMGFEPLLALEDDPRNVAMFHEEGIPCLYIHSRIHTRPGE